MLHSLKILRNRSRLTLRLRSVDLVRRLAMIATGIGLNNTGINSKSLTLNQALLHASLNHALKPMP
jgi:hypothetical protein